MRRISGQNAAKSFLTEAQMVKSPPAMQEIQVLSLDEEDPLEKRMPTHSSILCLGNPMDRGAWQAIVHGVAKSPA